MMGEVELSGSISHPIPTTSTTKTLITKEEVAKEIKEWMANGNDSDVSKKFYDNVVEHIELKLDRQLCCLETTWIERQYVKIVLQLWLKKSLGKAYQYLDCTETEIDNELPRLSSQLDSINSFEDIRSVRLELNDVESPLRVWCDGKCPYLQLILDQKNLFANTSRFAVYVNCYFKQFKTSCIDKIFSRCLNDIVKDEIHGEKYDKFINHLNAFLSNVIEEKNLQDILEKEEFIGNYVMDENKTGQDLVKKLVEIFNCIESEQGKTTAVPEWLQTFLSNASELSEDEWTQPFKVLTKETCKKFWLPKTEIEFKKEDGKQIISIRGVAIFVGKTIGGMNRLKREHPDVEEIKIVGLKSVHIDCDLDNDTWHGINIGIVTDKLIVDDEVCWDVSGKNATSNPQRGKYRQPGESGGNVHVVCNEIINGQKWTIVSDGGDGSPAYRWTKEEFEKSFPSMLTGDREKAMERVLTTLEEILPKEKRRIGQDILPGNTGNFLIEGIADDGGEITAIFYGEDSTKETLILIKRGHIGQGGYGGDITIECFSSKESSTRTEIPFAGMDTRRKRLTTIRMGVYEASGSNGKTGKVTGDVAFIHKVAKGSDNSCGTFYGFEKDEKILIRLNAAKATKMDTNLNVQYESKKYAKLLLSNYSTKDLQSVVILVDAVKKNAIIRQSLLQHFDQIDERKQMTKSIQKMLSNTTEDQSKSIDEIVNGIENKVHQAHQLTTQRQQHQFEKIQQEQYVRPAIDSSSSLSNPKIIGRRLVWNDVGIKCLDELTTEDDADTALHCLFGQMNSEGKYVCKDTNKFRKRIAKYISRKHDGEKTYDAVGSFVLRVNDEKRFPAASVKRDEYIKSIMEKYQQLKGMETQILRWLNHNEDYDEGDFLVSEEVDKWKEAWEIIGDPKIIKVELLKEQEDWRNDQVLRLEYAKYIESSTGILGLAELEILAITLLMKVNIYKNYDSSSFEYKETLRTKEHQTIAKMSNNPTPSRKYCILYEGNGRWKRLTPNYNLNLFCDEFTQEDDEQNCIETYFVQLRSWIEENANIDKKEDVKTSMEKLKNNTPLRLFQLLLDRINPITNDGQMNQFIDAICSLVKWVEYYNSRNISPIFYLYIIEKYKPHEWEREFLLLEMEERLEKPWENKEERENWKKVVREYLNNHGGALSLFIKIAMEKKRDNDILFSLDLNKLLRILTVLEKGNLKESILNKVDIGQKSLIDLFYKQRSMFWEKKVDDWLKVDEQLKEKNKKEYENLLLEMEFKNDIELPQNLTDDKVRDIEIKLRNILLQGQNSTSIVPSRNVEAVLAEMREKSPEAEHTEMIKKLRKNVNDSNSNQVEFENGVESIVKKLIKRNPNKYGRLKIFLKEEKYIDVNTKIPEHPTIKCQTLKKSAVLDKKKEKTISELFFEIIKMANELHQPQHICNNIGNWIDDGLDLTDDSSLTNFLCVFDYAVKFTMGFSLRDTQRVAIMTLLVNGSIPVNTLAQVSTGEGKSIIVAGVAIGFAYSIKREKKGKSPHRKLQEVLFRKKEKRSNNKIDVITSNDVLAIRDSSLSVAEGGLKELYEFFNVSVANNCSQLVDDRKRAYNMDVVYGQLGNFQRDYLLDQFYNRNIRGDRSMDYGIIDEVDCMLLDRGNSMLYLSHDIPGMEMLESLYVFIWGKIRDTLPEMKEIKTKKEKIKTPILYDLFGQISEEDLNNIYAPLGHAELASERTAIWEHLIEEKIIDRQGRLLINDVSKITEEKINYTPTNVALKEKQLNSKISFYFRIVAERDRRIRIPSHLLPFVDSHLDTWLDNARRALELKQDEDYVIDCDRSDTSPDLNPQVIIIDPDTGTDQCSSQWDGALHQFLQLKEGCKLTMQSLKAVFISNEKYMKKYSNMAGVSGTLGSEPEQQFLKNKYKCDLFTIPTASPKRFRIKPTKFYKTKESWWRAITEETRQTIMEESRSIVIFCRFIKEVNQVYQHLKSAIPVLGDNNKRIHRYTREYEKFEFEKEPGLDVGNVIVATNLAGRGTDIKISETLKANGGLHICLTYFSENERVEEQAMGRAARKGEPGSGILILCELPTGQGEESGTSEEWGVEKIFTMKEKRARKERQRISRFEKDFNNIKMLDDLIDHYVDNLSVFKIKEMLRKDKFKEVKNSSENRIVQLLDDNDFLNLIHNNTLDKWALWLDERDNSLKCFDLKHKERKLKLKLHSFGNDIFQWMTPARRIVIIKHLAMTKSKQINIIDTLNKQIDLTDEFFYPAAFYYRAFILLREWNHGNDEFKKEKNEFIRTLRNSETILNEHIDMQIFFNLIHQSEMKPDDSFCTVDGYQEQKENNIKILQYFLGSIQWLMGKHCSISDLQEAGNDNPKVTGFFAKNLKKFESFIDNKKTAEIEELKEHQIRLEKVDEYFRKLIKSECIVCELNHPETIPSNYVAFEKSTRSSEMKRSQIILQIADDYGISASLEEKLKSVFGEALNEEEIEKKLKKEIHMPCTRKAFWEEMVKANALKPVKECINMNCVIMSEKQLEELEKNSFEFDRRKAITLAFGVKSFDENNNSLYVLYNPTYDSQQELGAANKVMFSKEYVKRILLPNEYRKRKKNFESNKIAKLDVNKLKDVKLFGQLGMEDLDRIKIDPTEQDGIWNELVNQNVINDDGYLVPGYDFTKDFSYPECPAYANAVMRLVKKKFVAETVRQQWLKSKDNPDCLKAINFLRRKPYRDMLADLMAAHVISGAQVTENFAIDRLKEEIDKITENDEERQSILEFLTSHQPVYAEKPISPEFFIDFIEGYMKSNNFASELYVFRLIGFDHIIDIKDREWTFKRKCLAALFTTIIGTGGLVSMSVGIAALIPKIQELVGFKLPFGFCKHFFLMGVSDILYVVETILSRKDFTWSDYGRQRIRSAIGKMEPINAIKAIWKLRGSSNQSFKDATITNEPRWNKQADQNQVKTVT